MRYRTDLFRNISRTFAALLKFQILAGTHPKSLDTPHEFPTPCDEAGTPTWGWVELLSQGRVKIGYNARMDTNSVNALNERLSTDIPLINAMSLRVLSASPESVEVDAFEGTYAVGIFSACSRDSGGRTTGDMCRRRAGNGRADARPSCCLRRRPSARHRR